MDALGRRLVRILESADPAVRDASFDETCAGAPEASLLAARDDLESALSGCDDLYRRVRTRMFLAALNRRLAHRLPAGTGEGSAARASADAAAHRRAAFDELAAQVRASVRGSEGNAWLFACRRPQDLPLRGIDPLRRGEIALRERTPVRLDLSHSGWSDIFFLAMDAPEAARVVNLSVDLAPRGSGRAPSPPIEARLRSIDRPVLRLASTDLGESVELDAVAALFAFDADALGLLRAGIVASGLVPPGAEAAGGPLAPWLAALAGPGRGLELSTWVHGIPRGSRLAVSTLLLASILAVCLRATGQTRRTRGPLDDGERRRVASRAVLGEWLGGSAGGWQDSGGLWPGAKRIEGVVAAAGDPEFGVSRGRLLPRHVSLPLPPQLGDALHEGLLLAHGGMTGNVGPVLERVTEDYLLRSQPGFAARAEARALYQEILRAWQTGDARALARATDRNFHGPLRTILPQADNPFTQRLVERLRARLGDDFRGFWMLGGMSGGGMGFWVEPARREAAADALAETLDATTRELATSLPFGSEPVLYDWTLNERGSVGEEETPDARAGAQPGPTSRSVDPARGAATPTLDDWLARPGFDREGHERTRRDLRAGRIGLDRNRLPADTRIEDVREGDLVPAALAASAGRTRGLAALAEGRVAGVTLAGGVGSRWSRGGSPVKALSPVCRVRGRYRSFLDFHRAAARSVAREANARLPHVVTTSYATHSAIARHAESWRDDPHVEPWLSEGRRFGLRHVPTLRDLERAGYGGGSEPRDWVANRGETSDFREGEARGCLHPPGHARELPNLLENGVLADLLDAHPALEVLFVHNVDSLGARLDPGLLGWFLDQPLDVAFELMPRWHGDEGGALARVEGRLRLVEGLALPRAELAGSLSTYSSMTSWLSIDGWLASLGLSRAELRDADRVAAAVASALARLPRYLTLKPVRVRGDDGRHRTRLAGQVEQLWGDVTAHGDLRCGYLAVSRVRGQQQKDPEGLDAWLHDGSLETVRAGCAWDGDPAAPTDQEPC